MGRARVGPLTGVVAQAMLIAALAWALALNGAPFSPTA
jgi:hypothetical protein